LIGRKIAQYEVQSRVGEGGMGEVYRARDTRLDRDVAIKALPAEFAKDPERLARFRREARLLASLHHTNIAALHGLEEVDGEVFLVMELVEGEDLADRLQRGPVDLEEALDLARQFAEGLEAAHEQNIVHRDLKPANLKLTPDGSLKILDFGLARAYLGDQGEAENLEQSPTITAALTGHGVILGTAAYMSPEQARGKKIDQRTDIWAFGAILFEMLAGERIFHGETISDTMAAVLRADPPWEQLPSDTPQAVRRLLERCLERDGRRRLRDIGEARVRLEKWRDDPSMMHESHLSGLSGPAATPRGRFPLAWAVSAILLVIVAILGVQYMRQPAAEIPRYSFSIELEGEQSLTGAGCVGTLSPDGHWIAWNTTEGIRIRQVSESTSRLLDDTRGASSHTFSPDSRWLAFSFRGGLWRVSVLGGAPIRICDLATPRGIAWVDDTSIVMVPSITSGLHLVDIASGSVREVTRPDSTASERSHRWPTVVPDQRAVLYECQFLGRDYDQSDVRMFSLDDETSKTIYRGGGAPQATAHGQLLFAQDFTLFAVEWDGTNPVSDALPIPVLENLETSVGNQEDDDGSAQFWVDHNGTLLYLDRGSRRTEINRLAWLDIATGEYEPIGVPAHNMAFVPSPDWTKIAISRLRDGNENVFIHDVRTGNETMITYRESVEYLGAFSPDNKMFYWSQASDAGNRFEIWRRPIDGSQPPEFVANSPSDAGLWPEDISPNGRYLVATAWMGADARDLFVLDLENIDAGLKALVTGQGNQSQARWFGNDHFIYTQYATPAGELLLRRFPDTGAVWTFPEHPDGYFMGQSSLELESALAPAPDGVYRLPFTINEGSVTIGRPVLQWSAIQSNRDGFATHWPHPDGTRILGTLPEEAGDEIQPPSLVIKTGWSQQVAEQLKQSR
jgi:serine/threonine-protein kinase